MLFVCVRSHLSAQICLSPLDFFALSYDNREKKTLCPAKILTFVFWAEDLSDIVTGLTTKLEPTPLLEAVGKFLCSTLKHRQPVVMSALLQGEL